MVDKIALKAIVAVTAGIVALWVVDFIASAAFGIELMAGIRKLIKRLITRRRRSKDEDSMITGF